MTTEDLHFTDDSALDNFASILRGSFPTRCTDRLGNTCSVVQTQALELAVQADAGEISEEQARELAAQAGRAVGAECKTGLSPKRVCGRGVICTMTLADNL